MSEYTYQLDRLIFSPREVDFILQNLEMDGHNVVTPNDADYLKKTYTDSNLDTGSISYFYPKRHLVTNDSIRWFKDDLRATLWFYAFLVIKQNYSLEFLSVHNIFVKDFVLTFDCYYGERNPNLRNFSLLFKSRAVKIALPYYNQCKTNRDHLSWLNESNKEQMNWALDYLQEKKLLINAPNFIPINTKECYAQVCASLDALDMHSDLQQKLDDSYPRDIKKVDKLDRVHNEIMGSQIKQVIERNEAFDQTMTKNRGNSSIHKSSDNRTNHKAFRSLFDEVHVVSDAKKELLTRMRTAWNQKVFREKKPVKAEKNFKLPHGYEKKLNVVAQAYGEDMVTYLKQLIDKEYKDVQFKK